MGPDYLYRTTIRALNVYSTFLAEIVLTQELDNSIKFELRQHLQRISDELRSQLDQIYQEEKSETPR